MSKFKIIFDGYEEPEEYSSYDEALEAADDMTSNFQLGDAILRELDGDEYEEDGDGSYTIIEIDENGLEIDRY